MELKTIKRAWRLDEFINHEAQFEFVLKRQKVSNVCKVKVDNGALNVFQQFARASNFQKPRIGFLYGRIETAQASAAEDAKKKAAKAGKTEVAKKSKKKKKMTLSDLDTDEYKASQEKRPVVVVECVYEPLQAPGGEGEGGMCDVLDDPRLPTVDAIAKDLGMTRVGLIFTHAPGRDYHFSAAEIITLGQESLLAQDVLDEADANAGRALNAKPANGHGSSAETYNGNSTGQIAAGGGGGGGGGGDGEGQGQRPWPIIKFTLDKTGQQAVCEAYELSAQCLEMIAEDALEAVKTPGVSHVKEVGLSFPSLAVSTGVVSPPPKH